MKDIDGVTHPCCKLKPENSRSAKNDLWKGIHENMIALTHARLEASLIMFRSQSWKLKQLPEDILGLRFLTRLDRVNQIQLLRYLLTLGTRTAKRKTQISDDAPKKAAQTAGLKHS